MKDFLRFLLSKDFYKHIGIQIALFLILIFIVSISLSIYTDHGEKMLVPDFTELSVEQAKERAEQYNLRIEVVDSVYHSTAKPGAVVEQTPKSNFSVKENRKIFLTINSFAPETIEMPSVIDVSLRQATSIIQSYGLKIGRLRYKPSIYKDLVLEQKINGKNIAKGTKIEKGTKIDLVLGLGETDVETYLPELKGSSYSKALEKITHASLNVGSEIFHDSILTFEDSMRAVVWQQSPHYQEGMQVKLGSMVDLWLCRPQDSLHLRKSKSINDEFEEGEIDMLFSE